MNETKTGKKKNNVIKKSKKTEQQMVSNKNKDILFIFYSLFVVIFILIFFRLYVLYDTNHTEIAPNVHFNAEQVAKIPIDILIQSLMIFTIVYSGFEGSIALVKSSRLPVGQYSKLPQYKLNALKTMILLWTILVFSVTFLNTVIQPKIVIDEKYVYFDLQSLYTSFGTIVVMYIYVREGPKVVTDVNIKDKSNNTCIDKNIETVETAKV